MIRTIPGAVLDRRFRAGLAAEGSFEDEHRSLPSHACVHPDAGRARPNPTYRSGGHRHGSERRADRLRLHDLYPGDPRACVAGPHRPCADEALPAAPEGWSENVPFGLDEGLGLRDDPRRRRTGRVRPRPGDPGVRSAPPARLHLAHDHPRVGRGGWHGRGDRRDLARRARSKVAFDIEDIGHGVVKLTVTHDGFTPDSAVLPAISEGWPAVLASLKTLLETGSSLRTS
jgi:Activator of Hsp90 ATPase homolog 1-like protein